MPTIIVDGQGSGYRRSYKKKTKRKTIKRKTIRKKAPKINYSKLAAAIKKAGILGTKKPIYRRSAPASAPPVVEDGANPLGDALAMDQAEEWKLKRSRDDEEEVPFSDL